MVKLISLATTLLISFSSIVFPQESYFTPSSSPKKRVSLLMSRMTLDEKIGQMCQYVGEVAKNSSGNEDEKVGYIIGLNEKAELIKQGKIGSFLKVPTFKEANYLQELAQQSRLKIPLLIATDAIHGHGMYQGATTIYPTEIGIASTFDTLIANNIAKYTAREMRATGYHWAFSPNVEIVRDARWGRTGESFGEDPLLVTKMGCAMINGYQGNNLQGKENVLACAKHFIAGGIPFNGLNAAPTDISERTLYEIFFPPFQEAVECNVFTIMPAHNEVNGIPCHAHTKYLTDLLRDKWGFKGFYISDWNDIKNLSSVHKIAENEKQADEIAVLAGLDIHMHGPNFFDNIKKAVEEGIIPESRINDAVEKILLAKFQLGLFENPIIESRMVKETLLRKEHLDLALLAARKSIVLLENKGKILPLHKSAKKIFITGPNANSQAILGDWARTQPDENIVTVVEGMKKMAAKKATIDFLDCDRYDSISPKMIEQAHERAKSADVSIVVIGENSQRFSKSRTSGENLDRMTLSPPGNQLELVKAVQQTGKPVIVVLINGGPISSEWMARHVDAIIEAWEPGMYGGQAIAEAIFGECNPGGRLPITIPRSEGHIQSFYNHKPSTFHRGRPYLSERGPLYGFGYGLSYTSFQYDDFKMDKTLSVTDDLNLQFTIQNTGEYDGDEVILIYLNDVISSVTTPVKKLAHFQRIHLKKHEEKTIKITIPNKYFALFNADMEHIVEPGAFEVIVGDDIFIAAVVMKK